MKHSERCEKAKGKNCKCSCRKVLHGINPKAEPAAEDKTLIQFAEDKPILAELANIDPIIQQNGWTGI